MTTADGICNKCGASILPEASQEFCSACVLEKGLRAFDDESQGMTSATPLRMLMDFGDYELLEEIGRGGQGVVYRARQKSLNRIVALKVIGLGHWATESHVKRFRLEAEAAARLEHPGIVPIYEVGEREGSCYFSMKFVEGGQLDAIVRHEPMPNRRAVEMMRNLARTVHYAHEHGILHRDIKPGNVLLDAKGEAHLTDFGLAKLVETESAVTNTFDVLGTPSYMAPEQAAGKTKELTATADVYGLGAVFYQLLTGQPPFAGGTTYETIRLVMETEPRRPSLWNKKVDRDIETIALKCMEKDPRKRYPTALALAEDLEHWLRHEPIRARRTGVLTRSRKWMQRNPVLAAAMPVILALVTGLAVMSWKSAAERLPPAGIAVLPFENLSDDKENAFFADGMQDDILTKLAKVADLKVISRTSVMQYRGERNVRKIGEALRVSHILEGSVRRTNGRIHLNAQLIDARSDNPIWAQTYDRDVADVFTIQSEIAKTIADQLQTKIRPREKLAIEQPPTKDLVAYDLYARAKAETFAAAYSTVGKEKWLRAVDLLGQAVARDPTFLLAWCELADAHDFLYSLNYDHTPARLAMGDAAINQVVRLQPDSSETHLALAWHLYRGYVDLDQARTELAIAQRNLPNDPRTFQLAAYIARRQGRWQESIPALERVLELDPRNFSILQQISLSYRYLRRYQEMAAVLDRALAIAPQDVATRLARAGVDLEWRADTRPLHNTIEAISAENPAAAPLLAGPWLTLAQCERDVAGSDRALAALASNTYGPNAMQLSRSFGEGLAARFSGDTDRARTAFSKARAEQEAVVRAQPDYAPALCVLGLIDAGLGRKEEALSEGRRALELLPVSKDSVNGVHMIEYFAVIAAWAGEKNLALEQLAIATQLPAGICSYGRLKLHPYWDPLRGDPRFEKIVASLAPKDAVK